MTLTLTQVGVDVPRYLSVVGYDDSHLSHLMPIGLTTVRQDAVLMAEHAVRFAVERLEGTCAGAAGGGAGPEADGTGYQRTAPRRASAREIGKRFTHSPLRIPGKTPLRVRYGNT